MNVLGRSDESHHLRSCYGRLPENQSITGKFSHRILAHIPTVVVSGKIFVGNCNEPHIIVCLKHGLLPPQMSNSLLKTEFIIWMFHIFCVEQFPLISVGKKHSFRRNRFWTTQKSVFFSSSNPENQKRWCTLECWMLECNGRKYGSFWRLPYAHTSEIRDLRLVSPNRKLCLPFNDSTSTE